jgi:Zn-dependent alcohol dehydrogenase
MVGVDKIVGVDSNPAREEMARRFGMTHFVNPNDVTCSSAATRAGANRSPSAWPKRARRSRRGRSSG